MFGVWEMSAMSAFHRACACLFSLALIGPSLAGKKLEPAITEGLPPLIRAQNLKCNTVDQMIHRGDTERGVVFLMICDDKTAHYRYRLLYTPDGKMFIRP